MSSIATFGSAGLGLMAHTAQPAAINGQVHASSTSNGTSASTASAGDVTSADFLSLLVSELKNQDPTQPTDPTQYVQQLVGVNSLQQLIQINQDLGGGSSSSASSTATSSSTQG